MFLFLDTETDGNMNEQKIIELSYVVANDSLAPIKTYNNFISDIADKIYEGQKVYTYEDFSKGINWESCFTELMKDLELLHKDKGFLIIFNSGFDLDVIKRACKDKNIDIERFENIVKNTLYDLMLETIDFCNLRRCDGSLKWPKLQELCNILLGEGICQTHKALDDVMMMIECMKAGKDKFW